MTEKEPRSDQAAPSASSGQALRRRAEEAVRETAAQAPEHLEALSPEKTRQTLHELRVHQIELEMQNEELRRAQVELDAARARYFDLYDLAPVGYCTLSEQGLILETNLTAAGLLGVARGEIAKQPITRFILKEDQDLYYRHRKQLFETGEPQACELRMVNKGGTQFWAHFTAIAAQDADGAPTCRLVMSDITNRKQAEEALRDSEETHRTFFDLGAVGMAYVKPDGRFLKFNEKYRELTGHTRAELAEMSVLDLTHPDDRERDREELAVYLRGERSEYVSEKRYLRKDGSVRWVAVTARMVCGADGRPRHSIGIIEDITDRKRFEQERLHLLDAERAARSESERLSRMKDEFLATVSHELRSPLSAILGWTRLAKKDKTLDTGRALDIIERSAVSLTQLIEDMLDMSRITSGKVRLSMQTVDPEQLIRTILEGFELAADTKKIAFEQQIQPNLRPVRCDASRIQQVVSNLLSNAIKFTPESGRICVRVEQDTSRWTIRVQDSGKGISPEFIPQMFAKFQQADASTTRQHGGLGLGLAIVRQLVEMHGGTVQAESEGEGKGATFTVTLPMAASSSASGDDEQASSAGDDEEGMLPDGLSVLLVDDEIEVCDLIGRVLTESGARVLTATSTAEAWTILRRDKPDILVSDISMPGEDGYTLIRKIRSMEAWCADMGCIALTAMVRPEDRERALEEGFDEHLPKTIHPSEVVLAVRQVAWRSLQRHLDRQKQVTHREQSTVNAGTQSGPAHILLAEDNETISEMVKSSLEQAGHRVSVVASVAEGVVLASGTPVDLLLSDLRLKDGTGWDLMNKLREIRATPGIMVSGYSDKTCIEQSKAAGFTKHLVKPVDEDDLLRTVRQVLDHTR